MRSPLLLWHRDSSSAVPVQAGGSARDRESLPVLAGALGPGWEPLQSPLRVSAKPAVGSHRGKTFWKRCLRTQPGRVLKGPGAWEHWGRTARRAAKRPTKRFCPLTPWASREGMVGCVGQSLWCRVLGEETLDTGARRRAAKGTGSPVCHVPWDVGQGRVWGWRGPPSKRDLQSASSQEGQHRMRGPQGGGESGIRNHPGCKFPGGAEPGFSVPRAADGPGRGVAGAEQSPGCGIPGASCVRGRPGAGAMLPAPPGSRLGAGRRGRGGALGAPRGRGGGGGRAGGRRGGEGGRRSRR